MTAVPLTRRSFLVAAGGAAGLAAGCSGGGHSPPPAPTTTSTSAPAATVPGAAQPPGDLAEVTLAASLENSIVAAYQSLLDLSAAGKLGTVPAGVKELWQTFQSHHRDHATAWNAILTAAGARVVTTGDAAFTSAVVAPAIAALKDLGPAVALAASMEAAAAATYLDAIKSTLATPGALQTAAAVQPVEMQHVAILNLMMSSDPVPSSFATVSGARPASDRSG